MPSDITSQPESGSPEGASLTSKGAIATEVGLVSGQDTNLDKGTLPGEDAIRDNPFLNPDIATHFATVYEASKYECRHVFDPHLTWTKEEERKVIWKVDWHVTAWACVMFFALQVDRGNLSQAVSGTFLADLKLSTNDYNNGNTILTVCFLVAELPSQLISKAIGPDRWIPTQLVLWSVVAVSQCALSGRGSFFATRALLGLLEGGFVPDIVLWLSYFYTSKELPMRLSFFWTALITTGIATSLLAFAIFHLDGVNGWAGWRWLFFIEGLITLAIGFCSYFMMPASAVQTKAWFRPNGWFTDRETAIVVNRVLRDDPSKGDMNNREPITPRRLWLAAKDYNLWPVYLLGYLAYIPQGPPNTYLTLSLKHLGFSTFNVNLLVIPSTVLHIITLLIITKVSGMVNERTLVSMTQSLWTLPCLFALRFWPGANSNDWGTYALISILVAYPYVQPILVGWLSENSNNVGNRGVSTALYNILSQLGTVTSNYIYQADDAPLYRRGNRNLIIINFLGILLFLFTKVYYVTVNKRRERKWATMTEQEKTNYILNSSDTGSSRLDFRFAH